MRVDISDTPPYIVKSLRVETIDKSKDFLRL